VKVHIRPPRKFSVIEERQHNGQESVASYQQFVKKGEPAEIVTEILCDLMHGCDKEFLDEDAFDMVRVFFNEALAEARSRYQREVREAADATPLPTK
jgi:hypothetical protein